MNKPRAANEPYRLPPPLFDARCKAVCFGYTSGCHTES